MLKRFNKIAVICGVLTVVSPQLFAQIAKNQINGGDINTITTAVPFLLISPDSRAGGMGDAGVASSGDAYSNHWNPSKTAFAEKSMAIGISYTPWLRSLVNDMSLSYLSGYKRIDKNSAISASMKYFTLGSIQFTDINGNNTTQAKPNEFAFDIAYSRKLSSRIAGGLALRYINSNLTNGQSAGGVDTKAGQSVAADVSMYYQNPEMIIGGKKTTGSIGVNISNIGSKIAYTASARKDFIPINLKLGGALNFHLDDYNSFALVADFNKLLVPTPPVYDRNTNPPTIKDGKDPNRGIVSGMVGSFADAPGGGKEELREINICGGFEYWYDKLFAVRAGYFYENPTKGNRQYITFGAGIRYNVFGFDASYLVSTRQANPLANTIRFSLLFNMDAFKKKTETPATNG